MEIMRGWLGNDGKSHARDDEYPAFAEFEW
jgi:hypothetical protein